MDLLTRYAQAQREIALAIGEPPANEAGLPAVSILLNYHALVERAGNGGARFDYRFFTVLTRR